MANTDKIFVKYFVYIVSWDTNNLQVTGVAECKVMCR